MGLIGCKGLGSSADSKVVSGTDGLETIGTCTQQEKDDYFVAFEGCDYNQLTFYVVDQEVVDCSEAIDTFVATYGQYNCTTTDDDHNTINIGITSLNQLQAINTERNGYLNEDSSGADCSQNLADFIADIEARSYEISQEELDELISRRDYIDCSVGTTSYDTAAIQAIIDQVTVI